MIMRSWSYSRRSHRSIKGINVKFVLREDDFMIIPCHLSGYVSSDVPSGLCGHVLLFISFKLSLLLAPILLK